jgi:hypothetical protein
MRGTVARRLRRATYQAYHDTHGALPDDPDERAVEVGRINRTYRKLKKLHSRGGR